MIRATEGQTADDVMGLYGDYVLIGCYTECYNEPTYSNVALPNKNSYRAI